MDPTEALNALPDVLPRVPFFYLRHGETEWNKNRLAQGQTDIPLNTTGRDQAAASIPLLTGHGATRIIASPLKRAYETAEIVNRSLKLQITRHEGFMERAFGDFEGKPWVSGFVDQDFEGAETLAAFTTRILIALEETLTRYPGPVLLVCHGGVYRRLAIVLCGLPDAKAPNSAPFRFDPPGESGARWRITPMDPK